MPRQPSKHRVRPADIVQGKLGDCWLLSTLSVLADRPHLLYRILLTRHCNPEGAYAVRFFLNDVGQWWTPPCKGSRQLQAIVLPVPCNALALARNLHGAILSAAPPRELFPDLVVHLIQRDSGVCVLAINRDPRRYIHVQTDCTRSVNLTSSRTAFTTSDLLPPRSRQLLMVLTQVLGTTFYRWDCKYSFTKMWLPT